MTGATTAPDPHRALRRAGGSAVPAARSVASGSTGERPGAGRRIPPSRARSLGLSPHRRSREGPVMSRLFTPAELEAELRQVASRRYYHLHPFHKLLHAGRLDRGQVRAWALNRTYYQAMIPVKDALVLSRLTDPADRRLWRRRIVEQDGEVDGEGGLDRWLRLTDGLDLPRERVTAFEGVLPATRFAVDAYLAFVRERSALEAVASSLTEMFSATVASERVSGMLANYDFIARKTLAYFDDRLARSSRDTDFAMDFVKRHAVTPETQAVAIAAMRFKCDVLWAQLDALYSAYVDPKLPPPGAFDPSQE